MVDDDADVEVSIEMLAEALVRGGSVRDAAFMLLDGMEENFVWEVLSKANVVAIEIASLDDPT